jgi:hypothetical protein
MEAQRFPETSFLTRATWHNITEDAIPQLEISLHDISNDNGGRVVKFAPSENLGVRGVMSPRCNIHKFTCTFTDGKIEN